MELQLCGHSRRCGPSNIVLKSLCPGNVQCCGRSVRSGFPIMDRLESSSLCGYSQAIFPNWRVCGLAISRCSFVVARKCYPGWQVVLGMNLPGGKTFFNTITRQEPSDERKSCLYIIGDRGKGERSHPQGISPGGRKSGVFRVYSEIAAHYGVDPISLIRMPPPWIIWSPPPGDDCWARLPRLWRHRESKPGRATYGRTSGAKPSKTAAC